MVLADIDRPPLCVDDLSIDATVLTSTLFVDLCEWTFGCLIKVVILIVNIVAPPVFFYCFFRDSFLSFRGAARFVCYDSFSYGLNSSLWTIIA